MVNNRTRDRNRQAGASMAMYNTYKYDLRHAMHNETPYKTNKQSHQHLHHECICSCVTAHNLTTAHLRTNEPLNLQRSKRKQ
mmetsp:Transcript_8771/g.23678  ORF Transcript_8771/g.23678 Transcript_8771/m.23678 type:complete len:82 (+) Transcript_8771:985-1230(+)